MDDYEKLGAFYLGRTHDLDKNITRNELLLYDSKDLTTHAVCIGMTGSGKTGLCIDLLEEAAIDGIPALVIDPKGDMTNLLLNFPNLSAEEFKPWINENDARKNEISPEEYAEKQAVFWKTGLNKWDQGSERIHRLRNAAEFDIFTPGSSAGLPVSILKSFSVPPQEVLDDTDTLNERISMTTTSLLSLMGIDADPIKSREHILMSTIINYYWTNGQDLDLASLIQAIQSPPVSRIGVFDCDVFYPAKERFELAMILNNLLAAPSFQTWLEGESLDINSLLYTQTGKPRISIFSIAHLSDNERMFFVSLLLNQILGWIRTQSGTSSLKAILYFDEIFGYLPPTANPPSKKALLTLLKQARAFGLGIVLSTQNPVDLDYKGLSNTGTWFIGRLQTERDRDRVLDGLLGSSSQGFDRNTLEQMISQLGKRIFLLHNVHEQKPELFETRWAMSYLTGPLTRPQIKKLMDVKKNKIKAGIESPVEEGPKVTETSSRPNLAPEINQFFINVKRSIPEQQPIVYRPFIWGSAIVQFRDKPRNIDMQETFKIITPINNEIIAVDWNNSEAIDLEISELSKESEKYAKYENLPIAANQLKSYKAWQKDFIGYIHQNKKLTLLKSVNYKITSEPNETERDFRIRLSQIAREQRDEWTGKLREKYAKKLSSLEAKIRTAEDRVEREMAQAKQQKMQTAISIGTTILGAFLGRKALNRTAINKAGTAIRSAGRSRKEAGDVARAQENLKVLQEQLDEINEKFQTELEDYSLKNDVNQEEFETIFIRPLKTNISVQLLSLVWVPFQELEDGIIVQAYS